MRKLVGFLLTAVLTLACFGLIACGDNGKPDYGTLTIADITLEANETKDIVAVFLKDEYAADITYTFDGENISIENGKVTALVPNSETVVTATTAKHSATFTVKVKEINYGEITVNAPKKIYLNYAPKTVTASFTVPSYESEVTYTLTNASDFENSGITLTYEKGEGNDLLVSASGSTNETITAKFKATTSVSSQECEFKITIGRYNGEGYSGSSLNFENRINEFKIKNLSNGGEKGGTLFVGDSFFDNFWGNFYSTFSGKNAYRYGVSSSTLEDWLIVSERIVYPYEPKNIVLHCGTNDIHDDGKTAAQTADMLKQLVSEYHEELPYAKIFVFSIEPRRVSGTSNKPRDTWSACKAANTLIKEFCEQNSSYLTYIDSAAWCFTDANQTTIKTSFYKDGDATHVAESSYATYVDALKQAGWVVENHGSSGPGEEETVDYGTLTIANITMDADDIVSVNPVFSIPSKAEEIEYQVTVGNGVSIDDSGRITVLNADTVTKIKATTAHHEDTFAVTVNAVIKDVVVPDYIYLNMAQKEYSFSVADGFETSDVTVSVSGFNCQNATLIVADGKITATGSIGAAQNGVDYISQRATITFNHQYQTVTKTISVRQYDGKNASNNTLGLNAKFQEKFSTANQYLIENGTLFVGDSFFDTSYFWTNFYTESYLRKNAASVGISSTTVSDWLVLSEGLVYPFNPANIVLHLSTNDLHDDALTAAQTETLFKQLLNEYHQKLPNAKIYFFSVEPRRVSETSSSPRDTWSKCKEFNALMKTFAESNSPWLTYIDSATRCFTDSTETQIDTSIYRDGTHVTVPTYSLYVADLATAGLTVGNGVAFTDTTIAEVSTVMTTSATNQEIIYRGLPLTTEYVLTGKMDITETGNNAHYQFRFNEANYRFLIWDNNSDKTFGLGYIAGSSSANETASTTKFTVTEGSTYTIYWKLIVTDRNAYFYFGALSGNSVNYTLEAIYFNVPVAHGMRIGAQAMATRVYDMVAKTKLDDEAEYNALVQGLVNRNGLFETNYPTTSVKRTSDANSPFVGHDIVLNSETPVILKGKGEKDTNYTAANTYKTFVINGKTMFTGDYVLEYEMDILDHNNNPVNALSASSPSAQNYFHLLGVSTVDCDPGLNNDDGYNLAYQRNTTTDAKTLMYKDTMTIDGSNFATGITGTTGIKAVVVRSDNNVKVGMRINGVWYYLQVNDLSAPICNVTYTANMNVAIKNVNLSTNADYCATTYASIANA